MLAALPRGAVAQSGTLPNPKQFTALTSSRFFQESEWEFEQRAYPLGYIPAGARERAALQTSQARPPASAAPVTGDSWTNIGPAPVLSGQTPGSRAVSGRVASIAVDPANAAHWLLGGAQGGIWETSDTGSTWAARTDSQASLAMGAIAFAQSNPTTVYAGTGEANFSGDAYGGTGLLKSTDGGTNWQPLGGATFAQNGFSEIKIDPTNANTLVVATARAVPATASVSAPQGVFRSTDGGLTWAQTLNGQATEADVDPTNFLRQYAGLGEIFGSSSNGVYRSTNGGQTWTPIAGPWTSLTGGVGRVALTITPSNVNRVYVSIQDAFNGVGNDGALLGLFRTDNAWDPTPTWIQFTGVPAFCGSQCWYDQTLAVDPSNANILYAGGVGLWRFDGTTWTEIDTVANGIHVDQHSLRFAGARLIAGNDGGVWSTTDSGANWNDHNTTLSTIQFYDGSVHPTDPNFALGASQDNGTEKWTGPPAWNFLTGGDGADNAISSGAPNTNWAASFQGLNILRTKDGGASFIAADAGIDHTTAPFISKFEKCQVNDDVFIAGTDNVWRTNTFFGAVGSPSWSSNGPKLGAGISALAFAPSDTSCNTYAVGTGGGQLRLTSNGGSTWSDLHGSGATLPNRSVTDLAFDPLDANVLWVTFSGFNEGTPSQPGHVFGGVSVLTNPIWLNLSPPANMPFNAIVADPGNHNILYAGSDIGVWKTTDAANTWTHMGPEVGMPNVAVFELQLNDATNRLVAFTHGRGALALTITPHPIEPLLSPQRLVDTRGSGGPIAAGTSRCFQTAGQGGIPADATAAVLNVTAVTYAANGWLTLYPNGQSVPATSTLNFDTHEYAIANGAVIRIGTGGQVCVNAGQAASNVILDATGYVPSAGAAQLPLLTTPQRLVDTRGSGGPIAAGTSRCFQIAGQGGIPADATAAVLNVTAVTYAANGWLTLYPNGQSVPATSTLNFDTNEWSIANGAVIRIGTGGQVCINAGRAASNVILDATGYLTSAGAVRLPQLPSPQRLVDTRGSGGPIAAGTSRCFPIAGQGGIPANAFVAILNVTGVTYTANGWLTLYPNGQSVPSTSTLNFDTHEWSIANGSIISIGTGGQVCVNAGQNASDVIIDATGYELP